ncbi:hypothetical protein LCGC14_1572480 [marine sediment metagenome]|uniref:Uncharacterized protein n=1 Tax=marine sediment metagenome TaxID=412755 RepID=A0A0F9IJ73_9ZZZZ
MQEAMIRSVWEWKTAAEARAFSIGVEHKDTLHVVRSLINPKRVVVTTPSWADYDTILIYQDGKEVHTYNYAGKHIGQCKEWKELEVDDEE